MGDKESIGMVQSVLRFVSRAGTLVAMSIFYAMIAAAIARFVFGMAERPAMLFVFLPTALLVAIIAWPRLPKMLNDED